MNPDRNTQFIDPQYEEVCMGHTGYVEVCHVLFDSARVTLEKLCKFFFSFHDPTMINQ